MHRAATLLVAILLAACAGGGVPIELGPDGRPLPRVYRIPASGEAQVQFRMLDAVNVMRQAAGAPPVAFDARLNAAATTHARDMARQNRAWHFGSDGSSPIDRVVRVGYNHLLIGETISETYESELETLSEWLGRDDARAIILDPRARDMGFGWYQEENGRIWWALEMGRGPAPLF